MDFNDDKLVDIITNIIRAANLLERLGGEYAQHGDIKTVQQYMILGLLAREPDLSMGDLRQNTLVTKQAITGVVDRLNKCGFVDVYKDPKDRRITRVRLTTRGETAIEATRPTRIFGNREIFSVLSEEELSQLSMILPKLILHLKERELNPEGKMTP